MTANGVPYQAWNAIWHADWPGAADAAIAMTQVLDGPTGTIRGFDVRAAPGANWHDLLRNEGVEDINLLGHTFHAVKISHYREGMEDNIYRSVTTVWKDIATGALLFTTYDHIAGRPALEQAFIGVDELPMGPELLELFRAERFELAPKNGYRALYQSLRTLR